MHPYESADTEGNSKESNRLAGEVNITTETVEKPRSVLAVKKTAFENTLGSTFSNRVL
jgi:hypothetical protein